MIDTAATSRTVGACLKKYDYEFSRSNKPALCNVKTQRDYDVSAPYQQNNDKFASKQRLDEHCCSKPVCNELTLYEKEPVFKINDRGPVESVHKHAQNQNVGTSINSVVPRYLTAKTGIENSTYAAHLNDELILKIYLDRQGRSEYVNLANQIGCSGSNIDYVFYENQTRQLMKESSIDERKIEALQALCISQPREMVNLFVAPITGVSTSQRIEMAPDRLRQQYGVSDGFIIEPKIIKIRNGPVITFSLNSLKQFNENLNMLRFLPTLIMNTKNFLDNFCLM